MAFFQKRLNIRVHDKLMSKAHFLVENFPERFNNESDVFRAGVARLYNDLTGDNYEERKEYGR